MPLLPIASGVLVVAIWLVMVFARGGFWRANRHLLSVAATNSTPAKVVAVVPARNEADVIERAITSLLCQDFNGSVRVILVDDHSTDRTAAAARVAASSIGRDDALTGIASAPLPEGWTGKLWAVSQGVEAARTFAPDYLLFTDADIELGPRTLSSLVAKAEAESSALTSLMVRLHCRTLPEKMMIPAFVYFFFLLYPPKWIADRNSRTAGAAGGCMLVRPDALERAGGIAAIRSEIIDDCSLAKSIKRSGGQVWLGLADSSASLRPYESFSEIRRMIERTAFNQLDHSTPVLFGTVVGLLLTFVLPIALLFAPSTLALALAAVALALMFGSYLPIVRDYGLSPAWTFALPLSACFYLWATLRSAWNYWRGKGGQWKGRAQDTN
jgi:hopene-associated glycosyltransferase HpnB